MAVSGQGTRPVLAAGGVVRRTRDGRTEIAVVHRPRYDDWSLPKGKLDPGEDPAAGALREVEEETGLRCRIGDEAGSVSYVDGGRPKLVRYWLMDPESGTFVPGAEVDLLRWLPVDRALPVLSYAHDRAFLASIEGLLS